MVSSLCEDFKFRDFFLWYLTIRIKWSGLWETFEQSRLIRNVSVCSISQQQNSGNPVSTDKLKSVSFDFR